MQWPACRWKVSAAGAPGAKITSPSRRSCRASRRTTTNTISSRSARSRPCTRPICRSRRAPTSGTGSRLRNSRSNLEAGAGSKQLLADCDAGINGRFRQHSRWRRVSRRRLVLGRRRTATRLRCAEDRQSRLRLVLRARRLFRGELRGLRQHGRPLALADHAGARHRRPPARLRRPADRAAAAHRLQPRRKLPAPADIRAGIDVSGRASLRVGAESAFARQRLSRLRRDQRARVQCAGLQSVGDCRRDRHGGRIRRVSAAYQLRANPARDRREPRHGGGARCRRAQALCGGVHHRHGAWHHRRRAGGANRRGFARHGDRFRHRGVRRRGDRRARLDARGPCWRADRGPHSRFRHRGLSRGGGAVAAGRPVREASVMTRALVPLMSAIVGAIGLALLPLLAPSYYASLMIPFFGYAIALLGFNLLFGYTGLLSFGHAMFLGFGAYGAAVLARKLGITSFEIVLIAVMASTALVALPIGLFCVRYVGIFFGMLTLAFGMLFHSFLFKFYHVTG